MFYPTSFFKSDILKVDQNQTFQKHFDEHNKTYHSCGNLMPNTILEIWYVRKKRLKSFWWGLSSFQGFWLLMIVSISGFILTFNVLELCHAYIYLETFQSTIYLDLGKYQNMTFRLSLKMSWFCKSIQISMISFFTCNHELNFLKFPFFSLK